MPSPPAHSAPVQSNTVRPRITLCAISQLSPAVLVMPCTVPRITLRFDAYVAGERRDDATPSGSRLSAEMPRPSNTKPSMCVPLAPLCRRRPAAGSRAHAARQRRAVGAADDGRAPVAEQRHLPIDARPAVAPGCDVDDVARVRRVDRGLDRRVVGGDPPDRRRRRGLRQRRQHHNRRRPRDSQPPHRSSRHSSHGRRLPFVPS